MSRSVSQTVSGIVGKKYRTRVIFIWITLALYIGSPTLFIISDGSAATAIAGMTCGFSGIAFFVLSAWHFSVMSSLRKSVKTLSRTNKLVYADEIISGDYNTDGKMCFSKHLLYDRKRNIVVAYDDIVWIYKGYRDAYTEEVMFCTIDGKKHGSAIDDFTLKEFLKRRDGYLLGLTQQNKIAYKNIVNNFKLRNQR